MTASRKGTFPSSSAEPASDMARVDAHVIQPHKYDELPDLSAFDPDDGVSEVAGVPVRGRPSLGDKAKRSISLRLDVATLERFKATGPGWQTRMNDALAKAAERLPARAHP